MTLSTFTKAVWAPFWASRWPGLGFALWLYFSSFTLAQVITTVAGGNGNGSASNQLNLTFGVYGDGAGNLYVSDYSNHRILKFPSNSTSSTAGVIVAGGNGQGAAANQLNGPEGVFIDGSGNLYVADAGNARVQKFPPNSAMATEGVTVAGGNGQGSASNQLKYPSNLFVDGAGNLFVSDFYNYRVQKFPPNSTSATAGMTVAGGNGSGSAANQLIQPSGVFVNGAGNLYVADYSNQRVQKFPPNSTSATAGVTVAGGNGPGSNANQLFSPQGLFIDGASNLYVADEGNNRVQLFAPNSTATTAGVTIAGGNGRGSAANQLYYPAGIFVNEGGRLFISDRGNSRVQRYAYPPVITSQPVASSVVCTGATVTAQVSATTTIAGPSLSYQWYSTNGTLAGQTSPTLSITNVQPGLGYYVGVTSSTGLTTFSTKFNPQVIAKPTVSLVASGSLSAATPSVTLTASGASTYQFGPGATQVGNGPTATVNAPGVYNVLGTNSAGCSNVASVTVSQALAPDLTPSLYARPTSVNANTPISVVVDVTELNGVTTSGLITLKVSQQAGLSLSLPPSASSVGGRPVSNSAWSLSGPSGGYYTLTSQQVISGGGMLSVGLTGGFNGGGSAGGFTISCTLLGGSGVDGDPSNNTDADRLEYLPQ